LGVSCLGAAAAFFVVRQNAIAELDRECVANVCDRSLEPVAERGRSMTALSVAFATAGAVAVGAAVVLMLTRHDAAQRSARVDGRFRF
jgi:hypothetical protein